MGPAQGPSLLSPTRATKVRVSVRTLVETLVHGTRAVSKRWSHVRFQRLKSLSPIRGRMLDRIQREGHQADWMAVAWAEPKINDGELLVTYLDDAPDIWLKVVKSSRYGRTQRLLLQEVPELQS